MPNIIVENDGRRRAPAKNPLKNLPCFSIEQFRQVYRPHDRYAIQHLAHCLAIYEGGGRQLMKMYERESESRLTCIQELADCDTFWLLRPTREDRKVRGIEVDDRRCDYGAA